MAGFWWQRGRSPLGGACGEQQPTFKVLCSAYDGRCLAVRDGALVLAPADPADEHQHWYKDARLSLCIKDMEGNPVFSLVNKATGLAVQHSLGPFRPVRLTMFDPEDFDESVLWTESGHLGREFGCIRPMHNVRFGLDAIPIDGEDDDDDEEQDGAGRGNEGEKLDDKDLDKKYHDGVTLVLSDWARGDTQSWKILSWNDEANPSLAGLEAEPTCCVYCKADEGLSVTVRDGAVCLAPTDPGDVYQHWIQDKRPGNMIKDEDAYPAFALVNKVTGDAIRGSKDAFTAIRGSEDGRTGTVKLVPYNPFYMDLSVLWTTSWDMGHGFRCIHLVDDMLLNLDAFHGDGTNIVLSRCYEKDNLQWKIVPLVYIYLELVDSIIEAARFITLINSLKDEVSIINVP